MSQGTKPFSDFTLTWSLAKLLIKIGELTESDLILQTLLKDISHSIHLSLGANSCFFTSNNIYHDGTVWAPAMQYFQLPISSKRANDSELIDDILPTLIPLRFNHI